MRLMSSSAKWENNSCERDQSNGREKNRFSQELKGGKRNNWTDYYKKGESYIHRKIF